MQQPPVDTQWQGRCRHQLVDGLCRLVIPAKQLWLERLLSQGTSLNPPCQSCDESGHSPLVGHCSTWQATTAMAAFIRPCSINDQQTLYITIRPSQLAEYQREAPATAAASMAPNKQGGPQGSVLSEEEVAARGRGTAEEEGTDTYDGSLAAEVRVFFTGGCKSRLRMKEEARRAAVALFW